METTSGWAGSSWFSSFFPEEEPEACRFLLYLGVTFVIISRNEKMWMWIAVKYGTWNVAQPASGAVHVLLQAGYSPLTAMVLAGRGLDSPEKARKYLDCDGPLPDPFLMTDMAAAKARIALALERGEAMAVFGDYDVDGVTATCLLTDFLRKRGADCRTYITGRMGEGYGLNPAAVRLLAGQGVTLIVTVDCGITAVEEAALCRELGVDLIVTDHHECKDRLPQAVAVVDPHRKDDGYPHRDLSGVGVAFKLAAALAGDQETVLREYADLVCLGTVADVMPLRGENRTFVTWGLASLRQTRRPGLKSLMAQSGCTPESLSAGSIGFVLAPRINAAGRMGEIELAMDLFFTEDPQRGEAVASRLCSLNKQRQDIELEIHQQVEEMLAGQDAPEAIVLSDPNWHQGVVGIVASRIAEEFCCPTFLICLEGDRGKASSRSYGGFNLFASLTQLSDLLESYGGHELAAGFTISKEKIPAFREEVCQLARSFYHQADLRTVLQVDCAVSPELLSLANVEGLSALEPCGAGCPRPVFLLERLQIERLTPVGGGRHLRLRLRQGRFGVNAICFSATAESLDISQGELVDLACTLQINEFRGVRSVQVNLLDVRPSCPCPCPDDMAPYRRLADRALRAEEAAELLPGRPVLGDIWRYLAACGPRLQADPVCLCRKIVRHTGRPLSLSQLLTCLDIFQEGGLLTLERQHKYITITLTAGAPKADLTQSGTMRYLQQLKES